MSDWSGLCSASSLPAEATQRMRLNARLVEAAVRTPRMQIGESFQGPAAGLRAQVHEHVGGATAVTVDSLSWTKILPPPSARDPMLGQDLTDPYYGMTKNQYNRARFNEAFGQMVRGGFRIREGPKAGSVSGVGIPQWSGQWPNLDTDSPHGAAMARRRTSNRRRGYIDDVPLRREARIHDGSDCASVHPYQTHADWAQGSEEEEEEERHTVERIKRKYLEAVAESKTPVRESPGWKWCSEHQRWTRN